jgi:hypothetical protein
MPPKRKSTDAPGPAKKSRAAAKSPTPETDPEIKAILDKRWSAVSVTRNADEDFRMRNRDPVRGFTFICLGRVPWTSAGDEDSEEEDDDDDGEDVLKERKKDAAVSTVILLRLLIDIDFLQKVNPDSQLKPAAEFPGEKWIFTNSGIDKYVAVNVCNNVRDPDNFEMYVSNDSAGYGGMEIVENLMLDFEEFKGDWKRQWAVCEAAALFFSSNSIGPLLGYV